jgi:hypothetical protein
MYKEQAENKTSYFSFYALCEIFQNFTPTLLDEYVFFYVRSTFVDSLPSRDFRLPQ